MIRFLQQKDNRITKAIFVVIIGVVSVGMVVYLIPGLTGMGAASTDTYAVVYPHWYSRYTASGEPVTQQRVEQLARQQLQQQRYPDSPMILNLFEQRVGQQLVQQQVLLVEARRLGINATEDDVRKYLQTGQAGQVLYPNGVFIGPEQYASLIASRFNLSVNDFEDDVRHDIILRRLQALITAGVTVSDKEVTDSYRKDNIKIKFDYAVISSDDLRKGINPPDNQLEDFFKKNAARYASAVPEQARSRHILIKVDANADAKTDAAAKAKAEGILKQLQAGGNWADLAKKYSDDPGSKDSGGELGFSQKGRMVPEFDSAIFTQKIGDIKIVKSQFGYHIVQVEERQTAHAQALNEVLPTIQATLIRQKTADAEDNYAKALTAEATKNGLEKTAAAHHLSVVTTPSVSHQGTIATLPDGSQLIGKAFQSKMGDPPQSAATGEGYAIFQVTGVTAAHAPNFADWKSHVLEDYRDQVLPALLSLRTKQLADKAKQYNDLAKAAKELGATVKTSDLVGPAGQVPDLGQVGQVAPQLLDLKVGDISGPIDTQRTGVVAKLVDKQEPSADEIAKNLDQTRDQMLEQRRNDAFGVFLSTVMNDYKKSKRIQINAKSTGPALPGM